MPLDFPSGALFEALQVLLGYPVLHYRPSGRLLLLKLLLALPMHGSPRLLLRVSQCRRLLRLPRQPGHALPVLPPYVLLILVLQLP